MTTLNIVGYFSAQFRDFFAQLFKILPCQKCVISLESYSYPCNFTTIARFFQLSINLLQMKTILTWDLSKLQKIPHYFPCSHSKIPVPPEKFLYPFFRIHPWKFFTFPTLFGKFSEKKIPEQKGERKLWKIVALTNFSSKYFIQKQS